MKWWFRLVRLYATSLSQVRRKDMSGNFICLFQGLLLNTLSLATKASVSTFYASHTRLQRPMHRCSYLLPAGLCIVLIKVDDTFFHSSVAESRYTADDVFHEHIKTVGINAEFQNDPSLAACYRSVWLSFLY